jgi:hypothetical protein
VPAVDQIILYFRYKLSNKQHQTNQMTKENKMAEPLFECEANCIKERPQALLVVIDGDEYWIPKSQIHDNSEVYNADDNSEGTLVITEWIAKQKGLL